MTLSTPPHELLKIVMVENRVNVRDIETITGISYLRVQNMLDGHEPIPEDMALKLARRFKLRNEAFLRKNLEK